MICARFVLPVFSTVKSVSAVWQTGLAATEMASSNAVQTGEETLQTPSPLDIKQLYLTLTAWFSVWGISPIRGSFVTFVQRPGLLGVNVIER